MTPITGFEGLYVVDELGRVFSLPKEVPVGLNGGVKRLPLRELRGTRPNPRCGHLRVYLGKAGKKYPKLVHRLVAEAFIPNPEQKPFINHKDGNPANNHVDNLEWCTQRENALHAYQFGLSKPPGQQGERNSHSKLNDAAVCEIRRRHTEGKSCAAIAREFGLNPRTANAIVLRQSWRHVT